MSAQASVSEIIKNAARLGKQDFEQLFDKMVVLKAERSLAALPKEESALLNKINRGFPSEKWERLNSLNKKMEHGGLSEAEYGELMMLINKYEAYMVLRLKYLAKLATLRKVSLDKLVDQLGIAPKDNE